ncbi:hypothetical protein Pelo_11440 [Pelomyxa schiedti]|nr:hypothetical protein Pelo_11440 [Pelomyxa schiedti]
MPKCYTCGTAIGGSWNMTECGGYEETGRYLGVEGWFLYGENSRWVYCYCLECWKKGILQLSFVTAATGRVPQLEKDTEALRAQIQQLQQVNNNRVEAPIEFDLTVYKDIEKRLTASNLPGCTLTTMSLGDVQTALKQAVVTRQKDLLAEINGGLDAQLAKGIDATQAKMKQISALEDQMKLTLQGSDIGITQEEVDTACGPLRKRLKEASDLLEKQLALRDKLRNGTF